MNNGFTKRSLNKRPSAAFISDKSLTRPGRSLRPANAAKTWLSILVAIISLLALAQNTYTSYPSGVHLDFVQVYDGSSWNTIGPARISDKLQNAIDKAKASRKATYTSGFCCSNVKNKNGIRIKLISPMRGETYLTNTSPKGAGHEYHLIWSVQNGREDTKVFEYKFPNSDSKFLSMEFSSSIRYAKKNASSLSPLDR